MYYTLRSTYREVKCHMKRMVRVLSVVMCLLFFFSPVAEAVTFTSSGGSAAPVKKNRKWRGTPGIWQENWNSGETRPAEEQENQAGGQY